LNEILWGHDTWFVAGLIGIASLEFQGGFDQLAGNYYDESSMRL
jgi:hypothetical protein